VDYPLRDDELGERFTKSLGAKVKIAASLGVVRRTLTHRDLELHLFRVSGARVPKAATELRWVKPSELSSLGISTAMAAAVKAAVAAS
jgi:adenine-specific DNA glycosylase